MMKEIKVVGVRAVDAIIDPKDQSNVMKWYKETDLLLKKAKTNAMALAKKDPVRFKNHFHVKANKIIQALSRPF